MMIQRFSLKEKFMIIINHQLSGKQLQDLEVLQTACQEVDQGLPTFYPKLLSANRLLPNILYYQDSYLIGFLAPYLFYKDAGELCLLVHPFYRRQGIARQLLHSACMILSNYSLDTLFFSSASTFKQDWFQTLGLSYHISEFHMECALPSTCSHITPTLHFRQAVQSDIPFLCYIDEICFKADSSLEEHLSLILQDKSYTLILAFLEREPIGKAHIFWHDGSACFTDIAVLPPYQAQGYGGQILNHCLQVASEYPASHVKLDVEASNQQALNMYLKHGFILLNTQHYWKMDWEKFKLLF